MQNIGFIGLGSIGSRMAKNIVKAGYPLTVFDINTEAMDELEGRGAVKANSPKEVGSRSRIVFLMVQNFPQCESCLLGKEGLLEGLREGTIIICSTISSDEAAKLRDMCLDKGIRMLDSPVSGGTKGADAGTLTLMVAGEDEVYKDCLPVLETVGSQLIKVGNQIGQGQAMKAVNQHLVTIHLAAMAEALVLGVKSGLDPGMIYRTVKNSAGNSWMFEDKVPGILSRDFTARSSLQIQLKDLDICLRMGQKTRAPLFLGSACKEIFKLAEARHLGVEDSSSIVKIYEQLGEATVVQQESK